MAHQARDLLARRDGVEGDGFGVAGGGEEFAAGGEGDGADGAGEACAGLETCAHGWEAGRYGWSTGQRVLQASRVVVEDVYASVLVPGRGEPAVD